MTDDLLWQEIFSLREQLKIAADIIKSYDLNFDKNDFLHRLKSVDYEQLMEECAKEMRMNYYFTGKKIVEVEYEKMAEDSNGYDIKTVGFFYKNKDTGESYYIEKEDEDKEIFNSKEELIIFKIDEYKKAIAKLNTKIYILDNE